MLSRDDYNDYKDLSFDFTDKYSKIINEKYLQIQKESLDRIIDSSYQDLKLQRDSNISDFIEEDSSNGFESITELFSPASINV